MGLLENAYELAPVFAQLTSRPTSLRLVLGETYARTWAGRTTLARVRRLAVLTVAPPRMSGTGRSRRGHSYPTARSAAETPASTFDIADVVHMGRFVQTLQEEQATRVQAAMAAANEGT